MAAVAQGVLSNVAAAERLGLSARQLRRVRRRVAKLGPAGVVHGNTGRAPKHRVSTEQRERIVQLRLGQYRGFNDHHFTDKLCEVEQLKVSRATVRRVLREAGIAPTQRRRPRVPRRRRARKPAAGMMLLWDGSTHRWLEGRGPQLCLMGALDDATSELLPGAHFVTYECAAGYLRMLQAIVQAKGRPLSIYMDRHSSLQRNDDHWSAAELARGVQDPTQVGRALQALDIEQIIALSPQAKGRVERLWRTLQDRLTAELRLHHVRTLAQANAVLQRYIPEHNRRFALPAAHRTPAWRPLHQIELERVCSFGYRCRVLNDHSVRINGVLIDIAPGPQEHSYAQAQVEVRQLLDGSWRVYYQDCLIATAASTAIDELRALKGRYHWARPAAPARRTKVNSANTAGADG